MSENETQTSADALNTNADPEAIQDVIRQGKRTFTILGVVFLILGIVALVFPLAMSIAVKVLFGWLMLIAGAINLWHAFETRSWGSTIWNVIIALISLAVGVYLAFFPLTGLIALTALLGISFAAQGLAEVVIAFQNRQAKAWGWLLFSGAISVVLGIMLVLGLPGTAAWALGVLVGIHLLTSGIALIMLARSV